MVRISFGEWHLICATYSEDDVARVHLLLDLASRLDFLVDPGRRLSGAFVESLNREPSYEAGSWGLMQLSREKMGESGNRRSCGLTLSPQMLRLTSVRLHGRERNLPCVLRRSDIPSHLEWLRREFPARSRSLGRPRLGHRSPSIDDRSTCL